MYKLHSTYTHHCCPHYLKQGVIGDHYIQAVQNAFILNPEYFSVYYMYVRTGHRKLS